MISNTPDAEFILADVFGTGPYSGNSLSVFRNAEAFDSGQRQTITQELRHFESVFLHATDDRTRYRAYIHTLEEQLDFAGHPLIGAAAVLHASLATAKECSSWTFDLNRKSVTVVTERRNEGWWAEMAQGRPEFLGAVALSRHAELLAALNCRVDDLCEDLPLEIVSVGLPYLIVPLRRRLESARIVRSDFRALLGAVGAQFVYVLDVGASEGRSWDNDGIVEDIATGSAAGPVGAYLTRHGYLEPDRNLTLHQGRFAGRPSELLVRTAGSSHDIQGVSVGGSVFIIGSGALHVLPDTHRAQIMA
jgi:trans-2,3-dihydro-3-hydroxyanthranilate isomerase